MILEAITYLSLVLAQQHGTSTILDIRVTNSTQCASRRPLLVAKEHEDSPFVVAEWVGECHWRATMPAYHTNIQRFSIRIPGLGRSDCMKPRWDDDTKTGVLTYECCGGDYAREVTLRVDDTIPLLYARTALASPCIQKGELAGGGIEDERTIHAVQFRKETVRLQVFENKTPPCGLILNELGPVLKPKLGQDVEVSRKDAETALGKQAVKGTNCYAPVTSGSNNDVTAKMLRFKKLGIKVQ